MSERTTEPEPDFTRAPGEAAAVVCTARRERPSREAFPACPHRIQLPALHGRRPRAAETGRDHPARAQHHPGPRVVDAVHSAGPRPGEPSASTSRTGASSASAPCRSRAADLLRCRRPDHGRIALLRPHPGMKVHREVRWGEAITGLGIAGVGLGFYEWLEVTGPVLPVVGGWARCMASCGTRAGSRSNRARRRSWRGPMIVYATRRKSGRKLLKLLRERIRPAPAHSAPEDRPERPRRTAPRSGACSEAGYGARRCPMWEQNPPGPLFKGGAAGILYSPFSKGGWGDERATE